MKFGKVTQYSGLINCLTKIVRDEGVMAFYKGTSPAILKVNRILNSNFCMKNRA